MNLILVIMFHFSLFDIDSNQNLFHTNIIEHF